MNAAAAATFSNAVNCTAWAQLSIHVRALRSLCTSLRNCSKPPMSCRQGVTASASFSYLCTQQTAALQAHCNCIKLQLLRQAIHGSTISLEMDCNRFVHFFIYSHRSCSSADLFNVTLNCPIERTLNCNQLAAAAGLSLPCVYIVSTYCAPPYPLLHACKAATALPDQAAARDTYGWSWHCSHLQLAKGKAPLGTMGGDMLTSLSQSIYLSASKQELP